jgi:hypothetical protein
MYSFGPNADFKVRQTRLSFSQKLLQIFFGSGLLTPACEHRGKTV